VKRKCVQEIRQENVSKETYQYEWDLFARHEKRPMYTDRDLRNTDLWNTHMYMQMSQKRRVNMHAHICKIWKETSVYEKRHLQNSLTNAVRRMWQKRRIDTQRDLWKKTTFSSDTDSKRLMYTVRDIYNTVQRMRYAECEKRGALICNETSKREFRSHQIQIKRDWCIRKETFTKQSDICGTQNVTKET